MILKFTFFLGEKGGLFVGDAGVEWQTRSWSGDDGKVQHEHGEVFSGEEREPSFKGRFSYNKCPVVRTSKRRV